MSRISTKFSWSHCDLNNYIKKLSYQQFFSLLVLCPHLMSDISATVLLVCGVEWRAVSVLVEVVHVHDTVLLAATNQTSHSCEHIDTL